MEERAQILGIAHTKVRQTLTSSKEKKDIVVTPYIPSDGLILHTFHLDAHEFINILSSSSIKGRYRTVLVPIQKVPSSIAQMYKGYVWIARWNLYKLSD